MPAFLLKPRWLGLLAFVIVFGALCYRLGLWQWHRLEHRIDRNAVIKQHYGADPVPLDSVVPRGSEVDGETQEWTQVEVRGTYDASGAASVKFMTRDSAPGVDVVVPLRLDDGTAILVDRGWMQTDNSGQAPTLPAPPSGEVDVTGWLRPNNGAGGEAVRINDGQIRAISSDGYDEALDYPLRSGYLNLRSESPDPGSDLLLEPDPDLGQGPHFWYALQWWFFGLIGITGFVWFAISEARESRRRTTPTAQASVTRSR